MRRGRVFIYLALIIILGLAAFVVIWQRFLIPSGEGGTDETAQPTPVVKTVEVVVVAQRVPRGTTLDATVVSLIPIQEELFFSMPLWLLQVSWFSYFQFSLQTEN